MSSGNDSSPPTRNFVRLGITAESVKWRSLEEGSNGKLYGAPYNWNSVIEIDTESGLIDISNTTNGINSSTTGKWIDGTTSSISGKTYYNCSKATQHLIVDPSTSSASISAINIGVQVEMRGGAEATNGLIYQSRFNSTTTFGIINPNTDEFMTSVPWTLDTSGPLYSSNSYLANHAAHKRQWGMTAAPNGKVYSTPYGGDRVAIYDTVTENGYMSPSLITGGLPDPTNTNSDYFHKYSGKGIYVDSTGYIYIMPRRANTILKINTLDDTCTEIPLPDILQSQTLERSMSAVLGPDGKIYSTPWSMPYLFWIDPADDSIGCLDISTDQDYDGGPGGGVGWWTYGYTKGNSIWYVPGGAYSVYIVTPNVVSSSSSISFSGGGSDGSSSDSSSSSSSSSKSATGGL